MGRRVSGKEAKRGVLGERKRLSCFDVGVCLAHVSSTPARLADWFSLSLLSECRNDNSCTM